MFLEKKAEELERLGFVADRSNEVYSTIDRNIVAILWEVSSKREPDKFAIKMGVWINDPFIDSIDQEVSVAMSGFLTRSGADISENSLGEWWNKGEEATMFEVLVEKGIPDLLEFADIDRLIRHFQDGLTNGIENWHPKPTWLSRIAERSIFGSQLKGDRLRFPRIYNYYLSLLYFHRGDMKKSAEFASVWLDHVKASTFGCEPARTYTHLASCVQETSI